MNVMRVLGIDSGLNVIGYGILDGDQQPVKARPDGQVTVVEAGTVFKKDKKVVWRCRNCGYLHEGEEAPKVCPACAHPQAHFELLAENW